ncbi:MAG TPA: hypothetical protein VGC15_04160 [Acetobacteraceae bacterium]
MDGGSGGCGGVAGFALGGVGRAGFMPVWFGIGEVIGGGGRAVLRFRAGRAGRAPCGAARGGGAGVEVGDVGLGAALPGAAAREGCKAEVAEDVTDDVLDRAVCDVVV